MSQISTYFLYLIGVCLYTLSDGNQDKLFIETREELKNLNFPPCKLCSVLVDSFKKGLERTANSNFQGGDTAWEEERLGDYASSEIRFVEIQESLCRDLDRAVSQCHSFAEEVEHRLEEWWFKHKRKPDLFYWLCIDVLNRCCPAHHYGPMCTPCPGHPNIICSGNGKCRGAGTRKGNGTCDCDSGYQGDVCNTCVSGYYESYRDESKLLCTKCHAACKDSCIQAGPRGCLACNAGWFHNSERGCSDINECISDNIPCKRNEFCVNNEGSYTCLACDKACNGCQGDGPDMCEKCADGFILKDGMCIRGESEWTAGWDMRRYLTYLGLCIATCIIFQKNPAVASIIGLFVAIYVTVSEYMLRAGLSSDAPIIKF